MLHLVRAISVFVVVVLSAGAASAQAAPKAPSKKDLDALLASTDEIAKSVSQMRGLPLKKPITRGVMSRAQVEKRVLERLNEDYGDDEIVREGLAAKRFGLMAADLDYKKLVLDLYADQVAGFYDPRSQELYIADWIDLSSQRPVMAHEIDHALQDQSFDLVKLMKPVKTNSDEQMARTALVEGDGLALMIEFTLRDQGIKQDPWSQAGIIDLMRKSVEQGTVGALKDAPLWLRETMLFPYLGGLTLIAEVRRLRPWASVDEIYKKPPASTEQVLHPEKYFANERPATIKVGKVAAVGKGMKPIFENVMGELGVKLLLQHHGTAKESAAEAAKGWGGDRYVVYGPPTDANTTPGDLVVVWLSTWDTEADAAEAFDGLRSVVTALAGGASATCVREKANPEVSCSDATGDQFSVERKGQKILAVLGATTPTAKKVRADGWRWKATTPPAAKPKRR